MVRISGTFSLGPMLTATSVAAEVYCNARGLPHGCVVRPASGAGAPVAGVTANPGVGVDRGGPVNHPGRR